VKREFPTFAADAIVEEQKTTSDITSITIWNYTSSWIPHSESNNCVLLTKMSAMH
jgi:hypothetical protein